MNELRLVMRQLSRSPAFTAAVILTLALGIGASTLIFSVIDAVLLEPLPYADANQIMRVRELDEMGNRANPSDPNFFDLREQSRSFSFLMQFDVRTESVAGGNEPARLRVASVSREVHDVLGVEPLFGRPFVEEELHTGAAPTALISYGYWQRYLGGTPDFAQQSLKIGDRLHAVVGIMPPGFDFPGEADIWAPRELWEISPSRTGHNLGAVGRLAPGVSVEQARGELSAIAGTLKTQYGNDTQMSDVSVLPLHEDLVENVRPALYVLAAAAALLLFVACANVLSMLLARAVTREQELAMRVALGADRSRLVGHFFAESLVLCSAGGALALLLASCGADLLVTLDTGTLPRASNIRMDLTMAGFAFGVAVLAAAFLSLLAAWQASRGGVALHAHGRIAGRRRTALHEGLAAAQVALALVLVVGIVLLGRSFSQLTNVDPGFRVEGTVLMSLALPVPRDGVGEARLGRFYDQTIASLRELPGIESIGGITVPPMRGNWMNGGFIEQRYPEEIQDLRTLRRLYDDPARTGHAEYRIASEDYFSTMGIPVLRGRAFAPSDVSKPGHVAVISRSLAETQWPGEDPLGKLIQYAGMDGDYTPFTIIGIVGDVHDYGLDNQPYPTFYGYYRERQGKIASFSIAIRAPDAERFVPAAREIVQSLDPDVPPAFITSEELFSSSLAPQRFNLVMLGLLGGAALLVALAGIYGAMAFNVAQRTHEIGVRVALGARGPGVVAMVMRRSLTLAGAGVVIGVALALGASRLISSLLYGVPPHDLLAYAAAATLLLVAAAAATWLPARRASRVDPIIALRHE